MTRRPPEARGIPGGRDSRLPERGRKTDIRPFQPRLSGTAGCLHAARGSPLAQQGTAGSVPTSPRPDKTGGKRSWEGKTPTGKQQFPHFAMHPATQEETTR
ncbi:hypothetical protein AY555_02075 [Haematospirillum jordaniae]|uniref:Uncharacterized protein n=1 Tax=Haematospirillum jordaniae TaxID=1549855 RepID=A0A143DBS2_9PROT|nr:hypothetical protein AY555_02075 [Haematospirillum jordaniae]